MQINNHISAPISIHALRVEGDNLVADRNVAVENFYPRPPGGGRHHKDDADNQANPFLSTPSGWRATSRALKRSSPKLFLSTPSGWRATKSMSRTTKSAYHFYPRPPGGGRRFHCFIVSSVSCHFYPRPPGGGRLIHTQEKQQTSDFYPRPPGGGRPDLGRRDMPSTLFLSTPSGWRATAKNGTLFYLHSISIHALRVEGDGRNARRRAILASYFYPRPPGGGRRVPVHILRDHVQISIHALRVEGDMDTSS